ncbi:Uncharacterised protein [Vibrio cholerae]|nr:Uncharacterised protein [Vibrio cholerae]
MNTRKITDRRYNTRYAFQCHDQSQSGFIGNMKVLAITFANGLTH